MAWIGCRLGPTRNFESTKMREIRLIAHITLDGYVCDAQVALDGFVSGEDNLDFVTDISEAADTILSGRVTYELLQRYWPAAGQARGATKAEIRYSNWYNRTHKIVVSRTMKAGTETVVQQHLIDEVKRIKSSSGPPLVIFGSPSLTGQLMAHDLIDVFWIFVNPVLFGSGTPLFQKAGCAKKFKVGETRKFCNGEVALKYTLVK